MMSTDSKYEWECPVCGHTTNLHRVLIGDPPACPNCGHTMQPKKYYKEIGWNIDNIRCEVKHVT